jgi:ABC-type Fe3+ transport system permease subunit
MDSLLGLVANLLLSRRHGKERGRATEPPSLPTKGPHRRETVAGMDTAVVIVLVLLVLLPAVLVSGLSVWAAVKDGQEDKALQARLGIRRRTRLGR